jgi:hypothetical protein
MPSGFEGLFVGDGFFLPALLIAIAIAWSGFFPDLISVAMFSPITFLLRPFLSGILLLLNEWQEVAEHAIKHVAVGFVSVTWICSNAYISTHIECDVGALMDQRSSIAIEYTDQVKILSSFGIEICLSSTCKQLISSAIHTKMDTCLIPFFF